jgi:hypothetical protein
MHVITRLAVLLLILTPMGVEGQDLSITPLLLTADRFGLYEGSQRIDRKTFWQKVRSQSAAAEELARIRRKTTGAVVAGSAGILLVVFSEPLEYVPGVFGQRSELKGGRQLLGGGLIALAGVLALGTDGGRTKAVDVYNRVLFSAEPVQLGLTPHGLGLTWHF